MYQISHQTSESNCLTISYDDPVEFSTYALTSLQNKVNRLASFIIKSSLSLGLTAVLFGHTAIAHHVMIRAGCYAAIKSVFHNTIVKPVLFHVIPEYAQDRDDNSFKVDFVSFVCGITLINSRLAPLANELYAQLTLQDKLNQPVKELISSITVMFNGIYAQVRIQDKLPEAVKELISSITLTIVDIVVDFFIGLVDSCFGISKNLFAIPDDCFYNLIDGIENSDPPKGWDQEKIPTENNQLTYYQRSHGDEHHLYAIQQLTPEGKILPHLKAYFDLQKLGINTFTLKETKIDHDGIDLFSWAIFENTIDEAYKKVTSFKASSLKLAYELPETIHTIPASDASNYKLNTCTIAETTTWTDKMISQLAEAYAVFYYLGLSEKSFFESIQFDQEGNLFVGFMPKDFTPNSNRMENPLSHGLWEKDGLNGLSKVLKDKFVSSFREKLAEVKQTGYYRTFF